MRRGIGIAIAWVAATVLAVFIAAAAVGSVRSSVTDTPTLVGSPSAAALATNVPDPGVDPPPSSSTTDPGTTPSTGAVTSTSTTTTTLTSTTAPTPTTSIPPPSTTSTTTTTAGPASYSKTFDTQAGSVRVIVEGDEVRFGGAFPNPGWSVELEDAGPEQVKVHFERNDDSGEIQFRARLDGGELVTEIDIDDD